ncbi:MAG: DUF5683 domain-containing protein [Bacteroidota bacterium]
MIGKKYILFIFSWLLPAVLFGQVPDSIAATLSPNSIAITTDSIPDSTVVAPSIVSVKKKKKGFIRNIFSKEDYPNPKKALFLSMAIPGGGQIYNKRWWKLPFVYGGYTLLIIAIDYNTSGYNLYRDIYIAELAGESHRFSGSTLDASDYRRIRDGFDRNRQLSYIGLFALHLVQTAEAFVDCHLKTFDVSEDLSMRIGPKMGTLGNHQPYLGLGLTFQLSD